MLHTTSRHVAALFSGKKDTSKEGAALAAADKAASAAKATEKAVAKAAAKAVAMAAKADKAAAKAAAKAATQAETATTVAKEEQEEVVPNETASTAAGIDTEDFVAKLESLPDEGEATAVTDSANTVERPPASALDVASPSQAPSVSTLAVVKVPTGLQEDPVAAKELGHVAYVQPQIPSSAGTDPSRVLCWYCGSSAEFMKCVIKSKREGTWKCGTCNCKMSSLSRTFGTWPPKAGDFDSERLTPEHRHNFWKGAQLLGGEGLKAYAQIYIDNWHRETTESAEGGVYLPLSVWKVQGYDPVAIQANSKPVNIRTDPVLGTIYRIVLTSLSKRTVDGIERGKRTNATTRQKPELCDDTAADADAAAKRSDDASRRGCSRRRRSRSESSRSRSKSRRHRMRSRDHRRRRDDSTSRSNSNKGAKDKESRNRRGRRDRSKSSNEKRGIGKSGKRGTGNKRSRSRSADARRKACEKLARDTLNKVQMPLMNLERHAGDELYKQIPPVLRKELHAHLYGVRHIRRSI